MPFAVSLSKPPRKVHVLYSSLVLQILGDNLRHSWTRADCQPPDWDRVKSSRHELGHAPGWEIDQKGAGHCIYTWKLLDFISRQRVFPEEVELKDICHEGMGGNTSEDSKQPCITHNGAPRFREECEPAGIIARTTENPCGLPFRMLDGVRNICDLKNNDIRHGTFFIVEASDMKSFVHSCEDTFRLAGDTNAAQIAWHYGQVAALRWSAVVKVSLDEPAPAVEIASSRGMREMGSSFYQFSFKHLPRPDIFEEIWELFMEYVDKSMSDDAVTLAQQNVLHDHVVEEFDTCGQTLNITKYTELEAIHKDMVQRAGPRGTLYAASSLRKAFNATGRLYQNEWVTWFWSGYFTSRGGNREWFREIVNRKLAQVIAPGLGSTSGTFWYPPGGVREWHTNKFDPQGWRMYMVHVRGQTKSAHLTAKRKMSGSGTYFRSSDGGLLGAADGDRVVNLFKLTDKRDFWHCVKSGNAHRFSLGFTLDGAAAKKILSYARAASKKDEL